MKVGEAARIADLQKTLEQKHDNELATQKELIVLKGVAEMAEWKAKCAHLGDTKTDLNAMINTLRAELEQTRLNVRHVAEASKGSTVFQNIPSSAPKN